MKFSVDKREKYVIFKLKEEKLNSLVAPHLKSELLLLSKEDYKNIILDLGEVTFVDSSGLSAILVGNRLCKEANGTYIVAQAQQNVMNLITISQLDSILVLIPTLDEAHDYLLMDEIEREIDKGGE